MLRFNRVYYGIQPSASQHGIKLTLPVFFFQIFLSRDPIILKSTWIYIALATYPGKDSNHSETVSSMAYLILV